MRGDKASTLRILGSILATVACSKAGSPIGNVPAELVLVACDTADPTQNWTLSPDGWGANNTIRNYNVAHNVHCVDVSQRKIDTPGQELTSHVCCGLAGNENACKDQDDNYNQQWWFESSSDVVDDPQIGRIRVSDKKRRAGLCLDAEKAAAGSPVSIEQCTSNRDETQLWTVSATGSGPLLQILAKDHATGQQQLCLHASNSTAPSPSSKPPSAAPAPAPSTGAYRGCELANTTSLPFCDSSLSMDERAADLVSRMTLDEKLKQLIGGIHAGITPGVPRLGVPPYQYHSEGLHGLRSTCDLEGQKPFYSTLFPQVTGMGATFNLTLVQDMATHMSDEARAINNILAGKPSPTLGGGLSYWGPTMNVGRDPRWGRVQESVSEDPFLNGAYSSHFVRGFQATDDGVNFTKVAACCKHFYAYSFEGADGFNRHNFDAIVSERDLAETYMPGFQACLAAQPEQVMCSYNAVNGVPTCLDDHAQNGWLRGELGFGGLIVSDCDAIGDAWSSHHYSANASQAAAQGIQAGCDLDCGPTYDQHNLQLALDEGLMTEDDLDLAIRRTIRMRFNLGLFDKAEDVPYTDIGAEVLNNAVGQQLALSAAVESIVLLQNNDSALPLKVGDDVKTVAVIGPVAVDTELLMGGKSDYCPQHIVSLLEGLQTLANSSAQPWSIEYNDGSNTASAVAAAEKADFVLVTRGGVQASEGHDRAVLTLNDIAMNAVTDAITAVVAPSKLGLIVVVGEPVALEMYTDKFAAIVLAIEGGQAAGTAFAKIVTGAANPSGALPFTMYSSHYVEEVPMDDMTLRPNASSGSKGKTYRFYTGDVIWPFGYGLSYSTFKFAWGTTGMPASSASAATLQNTVIDFPVTVENSGSVDGAVPVQLYIRTPDIADAPLRSLVAVSKISVSAGATVQTTLSTGVINGTCAFCVYNTTTGASSVPVGTQYEVIVGNGRDDFVTAFTITAT